MEWLKIRFSDWLATLSVWAELRLPILLAKLLAALLVFTIGRRVARILVRTTDSLMAARNIDISLRKFLADVLYAILWVTVITLSLSTAGVESTAVVAVLGAASLAVGLALQGSLSNFAAGVLLIVIRPYRVGDIVVLGKHAGRVEAIRVFQTVLVTADNREITIPNGQIINGPIENNTVRGSRRLDVQLSVPTTVDLALLKRVALEATGAAEFVLATPVPTFEVAEIGATSLRLLLRAWVPSDRYQAVGNALLATLAQKVPPDTAITLLSPTVTG